MDEHLAEQKRGTRTWLWVILGVLLVLTVGCFAVVGTGIFLVSRNVQISASDEPASERAFEEVRARFTGQDPLVRMDGDRQVDAQALQKRISDYSGPLPKAVHVLAWNTEDQKLVRFSMPFWLLRMGGNRGGTLRIDEFDFDRVNIDPADLERAGPALVLEHTDQRARVIVWTE
jgi:hypothetical protein